MISEHRVSDWGSSVSAVGLGLEDVKDSLMRVWKLKERDRA